MVASVEEKEKRDREIYLGQTLWFIACCEVSSNCIIINSIATSKRAAI